MKNWIEFTDKSTIEFGIKVYSDYEFSPSVSIFPSFKVPGPFITYDISHYFGELVDLNVYDELEEKSIKSFQREYSIE